MRLRSTSTALGAVCALTVSLAGAASPQPARAAPSSATALSRTSAVRVPASRCYPPDNGSPRIADLQVVPSVLDVRRRDRNVTVRITPHDLGGPGAATGVSWGRLLLLPKFGSEFSPYEAFPLHWNGRGQLVTRISFSRVEPSAVWYLRVLLVDRAGNATTYLPPDLAAAGLPTSFTVRARPVKDLARPRLVSVRLSAHTVFAGARAGVLRLQGRARDDRAVAAVSAFVYSPGLDASHFGDLRQVAGSARNGVWRGRVVIPRTVGTHRASLAVQVFDYAGRRRTYRPRALAPLGTDGHLRVVGHIDTHRPTLRAVRVRPRVLDVRTGPATVTVRARVTDVGAGVADVNLSFDGRPIGLGHQGFNRDMRLVAGDRHDGWWQARVTLPPCEAEAGRWRGTVFAFDYGLPGHSRSSPAVRVINDDITPPSAEEVGHTSATGPLALRFDEDIVGVSTDNIAIYHGDGAGLSDRPGDIPPSVAGAWSCTNAAGAAVDCLAGPVRVAAFAPAAPFQRNDTYIVILNPEGHLGLTDLSGNPPVDLVTRTDRVFLFNHVIVVPR